VDCNCRGRQETVSSKSGATAYFAAASFDPEIGQAGTTPPAVPFVA
jgi:hypothetical protein